MFVERKWDKYSSSYFYKYKTVYAMICQVVDGLKVNMPLFKCLYAPGEPKDKRIIKRPIFVPEHLNSYIYV